MTLSETETADHGVATGVVTPHVRAPASHALVRPKPKIARRLVAGRSRTATIQRALLAADLVAVALALALALALAEGAPQSGQLAWSLVFLPVMVVLLKLYRLYDRDGKRLNHSTFDDLPGVFHAALVATLVLWGWLRVVPSPQLVLLEASALLGATIVLVLTARAVVRWAVPQLIAPERVLLVGAGPSARLLMHKLLARARRGTLRPVGCLRAEHEAAVTPQPQLPCLGTFGELAEICRSRAVDRVVIASQDVAHDRLPDLVRDANLADVKVSLMPSAVDVLGSATELDEVEGLMLLAVNSTRFSWSSRVLKRSLDVIVSVSVLPLFLLLLPIVAAAIKLDSPGPVFFRQERLGRGGRRFHILKLRTMVCDAEARVGELQTQSAHPAWLVLEQDPRVTPLGRLLRVTSIDELPQFWNVLRGEMSLVGPRPMPVSTDRYINGWGRRRLDLTPGITGLWQVMGRASISFEEMIKLDYLYVTNWSVWGDVRLLMRTVAVVLTRRGAN
ncbi:MAG TPA: sugar transferase [Baekduia sp.]|nr:sugar transferase [Baekduia sp.]